ncbi:hypothetical protein P1O03_08625, partial [Erysipelothrix rhusiopathiae]|nr:hypothetical protein [Erysipelothrix rhusiopathiae]MDE8173697.1 hypothetical protein [Erysipelothrix rhusiopathiae]MDE9423506.1 hypothetical protein [Erysipelothrix rhusiopathiae]
KGPITFSEDAPIENNIEFVKAYQELTRSYEGLVTYDDFNEVIVTSKTLQEKVALLHDNEGLYHTIKASLMLEETEKKEPMDLGGV